MQNLHSHACRICRHWLALVVIVAFALSLNVAAQGQAASSAQDSWFTSATQGDINAIAGLLKNGANVNARDAEGRTALHYAALNSDLELAKLLIAHGAYLNVQEHGECGWGWFPLHQAIRNEYLPMIRLLVASGADVNARRADDWTPLFTAAYHGQTEVIELLISHGARVNDRNLQRSTPLRTAIIVGKLSGARILLRHGANPNLAANGGETPLYEAAFLGYYDIAKALISRGANVNARTKRGVSVLQALHNGQAAAQQDRSHPIPADSPNWQKIRALLIKSGAKA